ncbi:hypothetical protein TorRG33x02_310670 [Trema orientale]|uniref:Uncharacterized protein n=1 Tax=Trema orientale TaxID=63057 RepID=A0A2P5BSA0_TREOI|nr:hypothetical protein TorRG33x02_310670 [Trema orientale]
MCLVTFHDNRLFKLNLRLSRGTLAVTSKGVGLADCKRSVARVWGLLTAKGHEQSGAQEDILVSSFWWLDLEGR